MSEPGFDWMDANRRMWDERVPIHVASRFYDVDSFRRGRPAVEPFEIDELGPLGGLHLCHLQCHFGMDTLDLVRLHPQLTAVGLDFSAPAIAAAEDLAASMGLADRTRFVQGNVLAAAATVGHSEFDVVYTGKGAICWIGHLDTWAAQCFSLLKPGGFLYLSEFHPIGYALASDGPTVGDDYFRTEPWIDDVEGSYADLTATTHQNRSVCWNHTVAGLVSAVLNAGFQLRFLHEYDYTLFALNKWLVEEKPGHFVWPSPEHRLPLMLSLKAYKPG